MAGFKISRAGGGLSPAKEGVIISQGRDYHAYECASEALQVVITRHQSGWKWEFAILVILYL